MLSIFDLRREGVLKEGVWQSGTWLWRNAFTGEETSSIGYELNTTGQNAYFRVHYAITRWSGEKENFDYRIPLQATACNFGGQRWWFTCPLQSRGRPCQQRTAKLYLPPGGSYYGCRHCYDLTYRSSQESDKRVSSLRQGGMMAILEGLKTGEVDYLLALKALPDEFWQR